jgi:hypothetical protein
VVVVVVTLAAAVEVAAGLVVRKGVGRTYRMGIEFCLW